FCPLAVGRAVKTGPDAALDMVLDAVHGVAAEAERRDRRAVSPAQVVRRYPLDAELAADRPHGAIETLVRAGKHEAGGGAIVELGENLPYRRRQPHPVAGAVLGAGPAEPGHRLARHLPPAVPEGFAHPLGRSAR